MEDQTNVLLDLILSKLMMNLHEEDLYQQELFENKHFAINY
jgi:hypothetical protein